MGRIMDLHHGSRKASITRKHRPLPALELLENRQLLSTAHAIPSYNLTGSFVPVTLPTELAGQPLTGAVTVAVKNAGTLILPGSQKVNLTLIAHTATKNITLETLNGQSVSSLPAGSSKNFSFDLKKATVPPVGDYTLETRITPSPALSETSTADNLVTTTPAHTTIALHVAAPDLTGTLLPSSLPALVLAGSKTPVTGTLTVQVANDGGTVIPAGEQVTLQIRAHNSITGQNFILNANPSQKYSVASLGIGQTVNISPTLQFTGKTLPAGSYSLQAIITPVQALNESNKNNNMVTANAAGQPTTLVSQTGAAPDLTGLFASSTVQSNSNGTTGNLTITLTNAGTATLVGPQPIAFAITARPTNLSDLAFPVTTLPQNFSVSNLKVGQSVTFTVTVSDGQLGSGTWLLTAGINAPGLTGPTSGNLIAVTKTGSVVTVNSVAVVLFSPPGTLEFPVAPGPIVPLNPTPITVVPLNTNPITIIEPTPFSPGAGPLTIPPTSGDSGVGSISYTGSIPVGSGSFTFLGGVLTLGGSNLTIETHVMSAFDALFQSNGTSVSQVTLTNVSATSASTDGQSDQILPVDAGTLTNSNGTVQFSNLTLAGNPAGVDLAATLAASSTLNIQGTVSGTQFTITFIPGSTAGTGTVRVNNGFTWDYTVASSDSGSMSLTFTFDNAALNNLTMSAGRIDLTKLPTVLNNYGVINLHWTNDNFDGTSPIDLTDLAALLNNFGASNATISGSANLTGSGPTGGVLTLNPGTGANQSNLTLIVGSTGTTPNPSDGTGLTLITINPGDGIVTLKLPPNVKISN